MTAEEKFREIKRSAGSVCVCGRRHAISLQDLSLREGALEDLPREIETLGSFSRIVMIADEHTYEAAGRTVESIVPVTSVVLDPEGLHANERGVALADERIPEDADLLIAVGSGTIHDITRYIAYTRGLRFVSVPTAASVDGFVSTVAAMTWNGVKRTLTAVGPSVMVADSAVMKRAPKRLTASGVGDLIGKCIALTDWKIGRILTGEYYCPKIVELTEEAVAEVVAHLKDIADGDAAAVESLQYGLVLSGLAMQMSGNSRPASGAEHHISHLIEMHVLNEENEALHGEKVGIGTAIAAEEYRRLAELTPDEFTFRSGLYADEAEIRRVFGPLSGEILKENASDPLSSVSDRLLKEKWPEIRPLLCSLPTGKEICDQLSSVGAPTVLSDIGLPDAMRGDLMRYSPLVRNRLTLMRIRNHLTY